MTDETQTDAEDSELLEFMDQQAKDRNLGWYVDARGFLNRKHYSQEPEFYDIRSAIRKAMRDS